VEHQKRLGADIIIPLDELPSYHTAPDALHRSLQRTHRWEARSLRRHLVRVTVRVS
jgi:queuine tRNA-ribosyltransferase